MFWVSGRITHCIVGTGASPFRVFCLWLSGTSPATGLGGLREEAGLIRLPSSLGLSCSVADNEGRGPGEPPCVACNVGSGPFQEMVIGLQHVGVELRDVQMPVTNEKGVF